MKKIVCTLLAVLLMAGGLFALASCKAPAPEIPEGYQVYDDGEISFAYPENWTVTDGSVVILLNPTGIGNNITVAYEAKNNSHKNMTVEDFNRQMLPILEDAGMKVSGVSITPKTVNGLDVTEINYWANISGVSLEQTLFTVTIGDRTYSVTVTETTQDDTLVENVFQTIYPAQ